MSVCAHGGLSSIKSGVRRLLLVGAAGRTEGAVAQDMGRGAGQRMIGRNINTYRNAPGRAMISRASSATSADAVVLYTYDIHSNGRTPVV